ncbi:MAG: bifunctional folylpolyglutamate synthase/dihydrofolate synthase, partial [Gammaproteobacteria bacterium]|nr:bifunctional folylpolyglutamate synthase/dihydrofolate synthase [Gammaproteobacteria bacterium]
MSKPCPRKLIDLPQPRFRNLAAWLKWQENLHYPAVALGLDRCRAVAQRLGLLPAPFRVLTVGGTNGKGSSATLLDLILRKAGYRVGRYTSPHLLRYNERICVEGIEATDDQICRVFDEVDRARGEITLTFFEFGTLAALLLFREAAIDMAVMEVGLGGRLDAVNVLDADAALITTVDLDHELWLGGDRESIGLEKAGICRPGRPAVCADPEPPASIAAHAGANGAFLYQSGRDFRFTVRGEKWDWRGRERTWRNLPRPAGRHRYQIQNAAGVLMMLDAIAAECPVSEAAIHAGL